MRKITSFRYGKIANSSAVRVERIFGSSSPFMVGRTAVKSTQFTTNFITGSAYGTDPSEVRVRAFAELVERLSAIESAYEQPYLIKDSAINLQQKYQVVMPSTLQHWDKSQKLILPIDREPNSKIRSFCKGIRIKTGVEVLVPALASFLHWIPPYDETLFLLPGATGLAAGRTFEDAVRHALLEVVERDACMLSWRVPSLPVINLSINAESSLTDCCKELGVTPTYFAIETSNLLHTVLVILAREDGQELTCGSACSDSIFLATNKALCEALALQWTMRYSNDFKEASHLPQTSYDHVLMAYLNGKTIINQYLKKARNQKFTIHKQPISLLDLVNKAEKIFESQIVVVDVTSDKARKSGWYVVRVIIPGALPRESDARIAHLGGSRLCKILEKYKLDSDKLVTLPHPFG